MTRPPLLPILDMVSRLLIVLGTVLIFTGQSIGVVPLLIGVLWLIAGLFGLGRPKIEPRRRPDEGQPPAGD